MQALVKNKVQEILYGKVQLKQLKHFDGPPYVRTKHVLVINESFSSF